MAMAATHTVTVRLPALHPGQQLILHESRGSRYRVLALGRRWGKTYLSHELAAQPIIDGQPVGYFAPDYKRLLEYWQGMVNLLSPITKRSSATERRIECVTGGTLECWTLEDEDAGRSRKYGRVIIDEAGLVADLGKRWDDAIRPTLADLRGDAWLLGTPKGRNFFWRCYERGQAHDATGWHSWHMPSHTNPYLSRGELEEMRREMPERSYRQEVLAEFLDDGGGVFRGVRQASTGTEQPAPLAGHQHVIGIDWGRSNDYSVFAVWDSTSARQVAQMRMTGVDYPAQGRRLVALCETWKPAAILAEANSIGTPMIEYLRQEELPISGFDTTAASKMRLIDDYALGFERSLFTLLADETQISEHQAYESERLPGGTIRYSAPEGMHDDTVIANALAWQLAKSADWSRQGDRLMQSVDERPLTAEDRQRAATDAAWTRTIAGIAGKSIEGDD